MKINRSQTNLDFFLVNNAMLSYMSSNNASKLHASATENFISALSTSELHMTTSIETSLSYPGDTTFQAPNEHLLEERGQSTKSYMSDKDPKTEIFQALSGE